jgi:galactokinase
VELEADRFDSVALPTGKGTVYMVLDPEQVKSAEPVTYDDQGNVIPLSERFNKQKEDNRYSPRDEQGEKAAEAVRKENEKLKQEHRNQIQRIREEHRKTMEDRLEKEASRYQEPRKKGIDSRNSAAMRHKIRKVIRVWTRF